MAKKQPKLSVSLTARERVLLHALIRTQVNPHTDLEHLIARADLVRDLRLKAWDKVPEKDWPNADHVAVEKFNITAFQLNVIRQAICTPGQQPTAWELSAGIARKLPPLPTPP